METHPPNVAPMKKPGLSTTAWIAIGCGGLVVVVLIAVSVLFWFGARQLQKAARDFEANPAKKAAEMIVRLNPELDLVRSDDQSITVRLKQTGEVATFDFESIREGKLRFKSAEGETTLSVQGGEQGGTLTVESPEGKAVLGAGSGAQRLPPWVPLPARRGDLQANFTIDSGAGVGGAVTFATELSPEEVQEFYRAQLQNAGFELQLLNIGQTGKGQASTLIGTQPSEQRSITVTIGRQEGQTQVFVQYSGKP